MCKTLNELYRAEVERPTPAAAFVRQLSEWTVTGEDTVRQWCRGNSVPGLLARKVIAEKLGRREEDLFPKEMFKKYEQVGV